MRKRETANAVSFLDPILNSLQVVPLFRSAISVNSSAAGCQTCTWIIAVSSANGCMHEN